MSGLNVFLGVFARNLSALMNFVAIAGMIASEINSEEINAAEIVIGIVFMNCPMIPLKSSIGKNTNTVVAVPVISGPLNVSIESIAASLTV